MPELALLDAVVILFLLYRIGRARSTMLGDSLHGLLSIVLLIALFLGFRVAREMREVVAGVVDLMQAVPGLGSKLLVIVAAWYLLRLLRERSGYWIQQAVPKKQHPRLLPISEGLRSLLLVGFVLWLAEGWFDKPPAATPLAIDLVRSGDTWLDQQIATW